MPQGRFEGSCPSGKVQYRDRVAALLTLASMSGARDEHRAYRCPACQRWNLTSKRGYGKPELTARRPKPRKPYEAPAITRPDDYLPDGKS